MRAACLLPLLLMACAPDAPPPTGEAIECALDGSQTFVRGCRLVQKGTAMVVYHPDGGFRRLEAKDGAVGPADGAEEATGIVRPDGATELAIGGDRYRIPMHAIVP